MSCHVMMYSTIGLVKYKYVANGGRILLTVYYTNTNRRSNSIVLGLVVSASRTYYSII